MTSRTCLLCGKTLSRIWVGSGEDFCSREHRNQYRLRRGMDRLTEANKISSVMRRRELPKPLTQPFGSSAGEPRMPDSRGIRIIGQAREPVLQPILPRLVARMPKSEVLRERLSGPPREAKPREFQILRRLPQMRYGLRPVRVAAPGAGAIDPVMRAVPALPAAKKGLTPRVSLGVRLRLPVVPVRQPGVRSPSAPHLVWPEMPHRVTALDRTAGPRALPAVTLLSIAPPPREFRPRMGTLFAWPGARPISARAVPGRAAPRETTMPLNQGGPAPAALRVEPPRAELSPSFARLTQPPASSPMAHRIAAAPFAPQDAALPSPVEEYQTK